MAKRIITEAPSEYTVRCLKCATHFAYTLDDVSGFYGNHVACPKCGEHCYHMPVKLMDLR